MNDWRSKQMNDLRSDRFLPSPEPSLDAVIGSLDLGSSANRVGTALLA